MPKTKGEKPLNAEESQELFLDIRAIALADMGLTLKSLGVAEADIAKATAECIKTNTDEPFIELMKASPIYQEQFKRIFG